ncbi:MAG: nucleoside hydrolase [Halobacteriaceae archaeon]
MARKVLFDVDPGCDDAIMLAMALGLDDIDVVGLTTVCGNSTVDNTTRNALAILEAAGHDGVPVAKGCGRPIEGELETAEWVHGANGIRGTLPEPEGEPLDVHAADMIVDTAREYGEDLTIAAVGPLPNLALALAKEPALPELVGEIYLMGGNATVPGNATPMAEANFRNDAVAASRVLQDAEPKHVGLDVTDAATVVPETVQRYMAADGGLGLIGDWLDYPDEVVDLGEGGPAIHDAAVVADVVGDVLTYEEYYCEVDTTGGPSNGATVCDVNGVLDAEPNAAVAMDIDVPGYRDILVEGVEAYAERVDQTS